MFDTLISNLKLLKFDLKPYEFSLGMIREHNSEYAQNIIALNSSLETLYGNLIKAEPEFTPIKVEFKAVDWISGQIGSWKRKRPKLQPTKG